MNSIYPRFLLMGTALSLMTACGSGNSVSDAVSNIVSGDFVVEDLPIDVIEEEPVIEDEIPVTANTTILPSQRIRANVRATRTDHYLDSNDTPDAVTTYTYNGDLLTEIAYETTPDGLTDNDDAPNGDTTVQSEVLSFTYNSNDLLESFRLRTDYKPDNSNECNDQAISSEETLYTYTYSGNPDRPAEISQVQEEVTFNDSVLFISLVSTLTYDSEGRLISTRNTLDNAQDLDNCDIGSVLPFDSLVQYGYDDRSLVNSRSNAIITGDIIRQSFARTTFEYDRNGYLISESDRFNGLLNDFVQFEYDDRNCLSRIVDEDYTDGILRQTSIESNTYARNSNDELTRVTTTYQFAEVMGSRASGGSSRDVTFYEQESVNVQNYFFRLVDFRLINQPGFCEIEVL